MATSKSPKPAIAVVIRLLRLRKEWSQEELALKVEVNPSEISHIESGRRNPTLDTLERLASGFGVRCSQMLELAEDLEAKVQKLETASP